MGSQTICLRLRLTVARRRTSALTDVHLYAGSRNSTLNPDTRGIAD
jgi:hypothetical protein